MNTLLSSMKVKHFTEILKAYRKAEITLRNAIDGGAGFGSTSKKILDFLGPKGVVFAFEPFPGNHRFFETLDSRIQLHKSALAETNKTMGFRVPSVVKENSTWGEKDMTGYSSVGFLSENSYDTVVQCVRADDVIPNHHTVDFIKLDLQRGEYNALRGMQSILKHVKIMWVEYIEGQELLNFLANSGFLIFDTQYLFLGKPTQNALQFFELSDEPFKLSTDRTAWYGFKKKDWKNFLIEFHAYKKEFGLIQTDLVCVNRKYKDLFCDSLRYL
jgi:FkbM family methyltransferase